MRGLLLTLEGIEGSGKTTQAQRVKALLDSWSVPALLTREPGGSPLAERIRDLVLAAAEEPVVPHTELLLFLAARAQHVRRVIGPALERGEVVVCDRFTDATLAYQGGGRTMDDDALRTLNEWATGAVGPSRTYLLDVPVEVGMARARDRRAGAPDRIEAEGADYFEGVRKRYLELARRDPERIVVLRGTDPAEDITHQIEQDLKSLLRGRKTTSPR